MEERKGQRRVLFAKGTGRHARMPAIEGDSAGTCDDALAQIVHDLKSPLATIALEVELINARLDSNDEQNTAQAIGRIRRNVSFLDRLIYDLIDMCTLSNGRFALRRVRSNLSSLLADVIDRIVPTSERHRVSLDTHGDVEAMV